MSCRQSKHRTKSPWRKCSTPSPTWRQFSNLGHSSKNLVWRPPPSLLTKTGNWLKNCDDRADWLMDCPAADQAQSVNNELIFMLCFCLLIVRHHRTLCTSNHHLFSYLLPPESENNKCLVHRLIKLVTHIWGLTRNTNQQAIEPYCYVFDNPQQQMTWPVLSVAI